MAHKIQLLEKIKPYVKKLIMKIKKQNNGSCN